jgi:hypothetical protein
MLQEFELERDGILNPESATGQVQERRAANMSADQGVRGADGIL